MPETQTEPCPACGSLLDVTGAQIFADRTCPVCATQINVRRVFGHYEMVSRLGHGGQGVVYRAVDNNLNRLVALKLLRTEYSENAEFVRQFESEAQVTASINHPNVVRVFSFGADEGHVYLAMELVDKGNLDELMEKLGRVPEARVLQIGIEIAQGLRAGAERGLVHRDVKPGNILFAEDGSAKIVDFGLAMFLEQAASASGEIWGTPYYLSPERLNRVPEDFRSDLYSLGATLFHAIAGRPPFEAEDASHVALKHLRTQAVSLQTYAPDVCNATSYVINRTLLKNPDERQQSYDEFIEQLQFAREEALARARGGGKKAQARLVLEDTAASKVGNWTMLAMMGGLLVALIVGAVLLYKNLGGKDKPMTVAPAAQGFGAFGQGWEAAREKLLAKDAQGAAEDFSALAAKAERGTSAWAWAIVHQAMAAQLARGSGAALQVLQQLSGGGTQVSRFFENQVVPLLASNAPLPMKQIRDFSRKDHEALGAFFLGMKAYEMGQVDDARSLISQFTVLSPEPALAWLTEYRKLAKPLQDEFVTFGLAADAWTSARTHREREQALAALREMQGKLPLQSKLQARTQELVAQAQKVVEGALLLALEENLAAGAKVTASGFVQQSGERPELALDGNLKTKWCDAHSAQKWIAFDLGAPKTVSRWVVFFAETGGETWELNHTSIKLEKSDDGKTWMLVEHVDHVRAEIVDRVIPPVTARHFRIVPGGVLRNNDKAARIVEVAFTDAPQQRKIRYRPTDSVALRFSAESPLVASAVGQPELVGSASFDVASGKYTARAAGAYIWSNADEFLFVHQPVKGDCEIIARVTRVDQKHDWTKAAVMVRREMGKGEPHFTVAAAPNGKVQTLFRLKSGQATTAVDRINLPLPHWIKVVRKGDECIGYESADGKTWNEISRGKVEGILETAFVGLAVCSHNVADMTTAEFDNVSIRPLGAQ